MRTDSRRLRIHQRLSCGEVLPRREAVHNRRRHQRNPETGDCPQPARQEIIDACIGCAPPFHRNLMPQLVDNWAELIRAGDMRALSRAITAIENHHEEAEPLLKALFPAKGKAYLRASPGRRAPERARSSIAWPRIFASRMKRWALSRSIRPALIRAAPSSATAFGCKATPATRGFLFVRWRRGDSSEALRAPRRKLRCCWMPQENSTCLSRRSAWDRTKWTLYGWQIACWSFLCPAWGTTSRT